MATRARTLEVQDSDAGERLDRWLAARLADYSRSRLATLIGDGGVTAAGGGAPDKLKPATRLEPGWKLTISVPEPETGKALTPDESAARKIGVLFEDQHLAVIDKPAGMAAHPQTFDGSGTLAHALVARFGSKLPCPDDDPLMPGIVHRLDSDTSGVMVIARTKFALDEIKRQFKEREVEKLYLAVCHGVPRGPQKSDSFTIDAALERDPGRGESMRIHHEGGKPAQTAFAVRERFGLHKQRPEFALMEARPLTGRTHQIRVHLASRGWPVVADRLYSSGASLKLRGIVSELEAGSLARAALDETLIARQALHAWRLALTHPATGARVEFEAPLPADIAQLIERLRAGR